MFVAISISVQNLPFLGFSLPYCRQPRQTDSAVLQVAVPASVLGRYFLKSLLQIVDQGFFSSLIVLTSILAIWSAGCQGWRHHFYCPVAFILHCCGLSIDNTGKRKITSSCHWGCLQWASVSSALCWVLREVRKEREDFSLGKLRHDSGIQIKAN